MSNNFIFFDIETGGFTPRGNKPSSLLSVSWEKPLLQQTQNTEILSKYSNPAPGSWVSDFSKQKILPQLAGKQTIPEKTALSSFIQDLRSTSAPIAGYNIKNFDIPFLEGRAAELGLVGDFREALRGKQVVDVSFGVKDIISESITKHAYKGTFDKRLTSSGGGTFSSLLEQSTKLEKGSLGLEFNAIHQAVGYDTARMTGKASAEIQMQGWKLEDVYGIMQKFGGAENLTDRAHESATDVVMTRKVWEAERSGQLSSLFSKPEVADHWLTQTVTRRQETLDLLRSGTKDGGTYYKTPTNTIKNVWNNLSSGTRFGIGVGVGLSAIALGLAASNALKGDQFSASDDASNTIEGLRHGGQAQAMRRSLTPFGSGWKEGLGKWLDKPHNTEFAVETGLEFAAWGVGRHCTEDKDDYLNDIGLVVGLGIGTAVYAFHKSPIAFQKKILSGFDDAWNTIEGLGHKGIAWKERQARTPFGSGWDALRNMTKVGEKFDDMLKGFEFAKSMKSAKIVSTLGSGQMGSAHHMRSTFRGKDFDFVRKIGGIGKEEAETMNKFSHDFAPTVYGEGFSPSGDRFLDMEMFHGKTMKQAANAGELQPSHLVQLSQQVKQMHLAGYAHADIHRSNVFITNEGRAALIDYGFSGPIGGEFKVYKNGALEQIKANEMEIRGTALDIERIKLYSGVDISPLEHKTGAGRLSRASRRQSKISTPSINTFEDEQHLMEAAIAKSEVSSIKTDAARPSAVARMKKIKQAELQKSAVSYMTQAGRAGGRKAKQ